MYNKRSAKETAKTYNDKVTTLMKPILICPCVSNLNHILFSSFTFKCLIFIIIKVLKNAKKITL